MRPDVVAFVGQQASHALLAVVLATAHFTLVRRDRRQFLSLWGAAWCAIAGARALTALEAATAPTPGLLTPLNAGLGFVNDWFGSLAIAATAGGVFAFSRRQDVPRRLLVGFTVGAAVLALGTAVIGPAEWRYTVRTALGALACLAAAPLIWRGGTGRAAARAVALAVGAYSIPLGLYAIVLGPGRSPNFDQAIAVGHLDVVLMTTMALAMIVWLLEGERVTATQAIEREQTVRADIEAREIRFRSVLDQVPDAITVLDAAGRYLVDLRPNRRFLGIPTEELIGSSVFDLVHPDDRASAMAILGSLRGRPGATEHGEIRLRHADGHWMVLECSGTNCEHVPALGGILVVARDVTDRRTLERRLAEAERLETVGRLAGGVAHDFNNLLTVVRGNAALLAPLLPAGTPGRSFADEIAEAAIRGAHLTHHLLAFARRESVEPRIVDLNLLVADLLPILRRLSGESVTLAWTPSAAPSIIRADPHRIEQVLVNLCANARDAMPNGGLLAISTESQSPDQVTLRVSDTGIGMTEATRIRAFEPFFTTKPAGTGTGLGLATSYGIVQQAGGTIVIDSEPGRGTSITIRFPGTTERPSRAVKVPAVERGRGSGVVLLAEDEAGVRSIAARVLRGAGFEVIEAVDGLDAVERWGTRPGVRCVVTDIVMPRLTGDALAHQIWAASPDTPVLFTSGYAQAFRPESIPSHLRSAFLQKPYDPEELVAAVLNLTG